MRERPPLTILDANVWLDCFRRPDQERVRLLLKRAVRSKQVRPILTPVVISELASGWEEGRSVDRLTVMRFAWDMSGARVLLGEPTREQGELVLRRPLREHELMADSVPYRSELFGLPFAQQIASDLKNVHREHKANEKTRREGSLDSLSREQLQLVLGTAEARLSLSRSWATDDMVETATKMGLPTDNLPDPSKVPSFFGAKVIHVERITRVLLEGRSTTKPGIADTALLADAIACGRAVLVTGDAPLIELAERLTPLFPRVAVVHTDAWFAPL